MAHAHRAGSLKQRNKPFKKRTAAPAPVSATAFRAAERRKAAAPAITAAVRAINKQQRGLKTEQKRNLQLQRLQKLRQSLRGSAACNHAALPPRVVLVISFNKFLPSSCVCAALAQQLAADAPQTSRFANSAGAAAAIAVAGGPAASATVSAAVEQQYAQTEGVGAGPEGGNSAGREEPVATAVAGQDSSSASCFYGKESNKNSGNVMYSRNNIQNAGEITASSTETFVHALPSYACCPSLPQRTQQRLLLLPSPHPQEHLQLLTLCSCADLLLCVFAGECTYTSPAFDEEGYRFLAALKMQGVPPVTGVGLSPTALNTLLASSASQQQQREHPSDNAAAEMMKGEGMQAEMEMAGPAAEGMSAAAVDNTSNKKEKDKESLRFQQRYFHSEFGQDKRFVSVNTPGDWRKVLRAVGSAHIPPDVAAAPTAAPAAAGDLQWRKGRGYLLALDWRLLTEKQLQEQKYPAVHVQQQQQQQGKVESVDKLYLQVDGFVRGVGFTKRLPIHVTGVGNFIAQRIEVLHATPTRGASPQQAISVCTNGHSSHHHSCRDSSSSSCVDSSSGSTMGVKEGGDVDMMGVRGGECEEEDERGIEELDCEELSAAERTELLQLIKPLQPFDRSSLEQTWPTDAELLQQTGLQQTDLQQTGLQQTDLQQRSKNSERMSRGEEEAGGLLDEVSSDRAEGEEKEEENSDDEVDGRWDEEFMTGNKDSADLPSLHSGDPKRNYTIEQRAAEDLEFPDEVDTPLNIEARVRFQKFRGLKSFRTSTWNREMDLPLEYSRVVDFQRLKSLQMYAYATLRNLCARNIFQGRFCRITIPLHLTPQSADSAGADSAAADSAAAVAVPSSTAACSSSLLHLPSSQYSSEASWEQLLLRCSAHPLLHRTVQNLHDQLSAAIPSFSTSSFSSSTADTASPASCCSTPTSSFSAAANPSVPSATGGSCPAAAVGGSSPAAAAAAGGSCAAAFNTCGSGAGRGLWQQVLPTHLVISTLLPFETAVSVSHMSLTRGGGGIGGDIQQRSIKSKEEVLLACGFRRFLARPIFSTVAATSASGGAAATEKAKFLPFFHPSSSCIATLYCCTVFPPTTVLAFVRSKQQPESQPHPQQQQQHSQHPKQQQQHLKEEEEQQQRRTQQDQMVSGEAPGGTVSAALCCDKTWDVFAWGSVLHSSSNRIILKRIVLTGYPFRVHKRKAVIRYMFFNPRDIRWFMPVELHTKKGLRGNIMQPLGTHGYMKCRFNLPIKQDDTVCMPLYKRVFPKWYPPSWNGHINQLPDNDNDTETTRQEPHHPQQQSALQQQKQQQELPAVSEEVEMLA